MSTIDLSDCKEWSNGDFSTESGKYINNIETEERDNNNPVTTESKKLDINAITELEKKD